MTMMLLKVRPPGSRVLRSLREVQRPDRAMTKVTNWCVYVILCTDNSLYTGISTDVEQRLFAHSNRQGAKYFRGRQPRRVVYLETGHTRSSAGRREAAIKKMRRIEKHRLIASAMNQVSAVAGRKLMFPEGAAYFRDHK